MKESKKIYLALGFLALCAIVLAAVPALMVWRWEMMSLSDPAALIGLIASWVVALVLLVGCGWYYRQVRERAQHRAAAPVPSAAES